MELAEEYRLSVYQDLGKLADKEQVHIVRNEVTGQICVRKSVALEQAGIYEFLQTNQSPYLPVIYECIRKEAELVVIEEYLTGKNLGEWLRNHAFSEEEVTRIGIDLCQAMAPLHHADPPIICRDLKPENVIVTLEGQLKVVDFDIARTYQPGQSKDTVMMGTQGYAAPEQFGFGQTDARTDIYGIGVLLNYLLIKRFPVEKIVQGKLGEIVHCCTQLDPKDRFQSVEALENALTSLQCNTDGTLSVRTGDQGKAGGIYIQSNQNEKSRKQMYKDCGYHIPGFRSRTPWKMIVAILGYSLLTWFCFTLEFQNADGVAYDWRGQWIDRICVWVSQIVFIFLVCDYREVKRHIPLLRSDRRTVRVIVYVATEMVVFFAAAIVCAILEAIIL